MGFLTANDGPLLSTKVTISFWFRVPKESIAAANAEYAIAAAAANAPNGPPIPPMVGKIPLLMFGPHDLTNKKPTPKLTNFGTNTILTIQFGTPPNFCQWWAPPSFGGFFGIPLTFNPETVDNTLVVDNGGPWVEYTPYPDKVEPSYIAVDTSDGGGKLVFHLVMDPEDIGAITGTSMGAKLVDQQTLPQPIPQYTSIHRFDNFGNLCSNDPPLIPGTPEPVPLATVTTTNTYEQFNGYPGVAAERFGSFEGGVPVSEDHWHHVLFSFDLATVKTHSAGPGNPVSGGKLMGVDKAATFHLAVDDENKVGKNISSHTTDNKNGVASQLGYRTAQSESNPFNGCDSGVVSGKGQFIVRCQVGLSPSTYVYESEGVPLNRFRIPGDPEHVKRVEMAELQIFDGLKIDTKDENTRRLFITENGKPASMSKPAKEYGIKPIFKLHKSANWIKGTNTGDQFLGEDTGNLASHDFSPSGDIEAWTPDPNLNGRQFPKT